MAGQIDFSGRQISVKTLTVSDVREVLNKIQKSVEEDKSVLDLDIVDLLFDDDVPAIAVAMATGLTLTELAGNIPPQDVRNLIDEVKAANPFFVGMMARLVAIGKGAGKTKPVPSSRPSVS